jgi:hypothetical protein
MEWLTLLLFALCPLMMLFCMRGMFTGNKKESNKPHNITSSSEPSEMQSLQLKMAELMEQNHQLMKEVESIKQIKTSKAVSDENENQQQQNKNIS